HLPTGVNESFRIYRRYTVTWVIDGSSEQEYYLYSFMPEHEDPVKEGDGHHTYVFTGWTPEITAVTGNATYTAVFEEIPEMYTVTWLNWDGSLLETDEVAYGEMPAYHGETPSREDEPGVRYTFAGWTPELAAVTGDAAYTALFDAEHVHEWGEPEYVWGEFDRSVTATRRCRFDESHVESETVEASYAVIQFATCEESGSGIWTSAAFENPAFEVQTKVVEIPALGHEWCEPEYVWGEFDHSVTATRTCKNDESHVESETVAASYAVIQAATCEESGSGIWTSAAFENPAFEVQTKVVEIPALGHDWGEPEWTWAEDYSRAEAAFVCANDDTHVLTLDAEVTVEEGSGEDEGYLIYTAAVTGPDGETYTDVLRAEKPVTQEILRVYGNTRYKTGLAIAEEYKKESGAEKFDAVILATGDGFADALAGSYLAYQKKAPILLTRARDVSLVNGYIRENLEAGGTVYVLGGEKAFPEEWLAGLEGFAVKRISGSTRYNTGVEILREAGVAAGEEVLICTGENFADSLSVASSGKALFLVKESLNKNQKAMLAELAGKGCTFTILGGEKAVTLDMEDLIRAEVGDALASERIAGSTRYRTSAILAERYFPNAESIVLATGETYPDGLCGGPLGALRGAPIVLTKAGQEKAARDYASA
ncbi:MAG: cell wall-binding repeat-containing protein, partial [Lachnospiraceae bacterium]|nr:cell wall-binding repeat-containing protein [Lachnospiraceae bacterium]